jgi:ribonucleoside-diphosphate reductase subunit M2
VEIISSAIEIEMEFIADALPIELIGMNSVMMCITSNSAPIHF